MAGYSGYSMSNNALEAYKNDEMPLSKWTKKEIVDRCNEINDEIDFNKLTHQELKDNFLKYTAYHHTSKFFNTTSFYAIDYEAVEAFTEDMMNSIIAERKPKAKKTTEQKAEEAAVKERAATERRYKALCKTTGQNEAYIDKTSLRSCSILQITERCELLEKLIAEYNDNIRYSRSYHYEFKYKTIRGFVNAALDGKYKSIGEQTFNKIIPIVKDIKTSGYTPSKRLVACMEKVNDVAGKKCSIRNLKSEVKKQPGNAELKKAAEGAIKEMARQDQLKAAKQPVKALVPQA